MSIYFETVAFRFNDGKARRRLERRRTGRSTVTGNVTILFEDETRRENVLQATLRDFSIQGFKLDVPQRIPLRTLVTFTCQKLGLHGRGTVRYCSPGKAGYEVGLELTSSAAPGSSAEHNLIEAKRSK